MKNRILVLTFAAFLLVALAALPLRGQEPSPLEAWIDKYSAVLPASAAECSPEREPEIAKAVDAIEKWAAYLARYQGVRRREDVVPRVDQLVAAKQRIDALLDGVLALRVQFATQPAGPERRERLRSYLRITSGLIDLSGRMRFQLEESLNYAAYLIASRPDLRDQVIEIFNRRNSGIGTTVMSLALFDPPPDAPNEAKPSSRNSKIKLLELISKTGELSQVGELAAFLREESTPPDLAILAAYTIRKLGLPQDPRPEQDESLPTPPITAAGLHEILAGLSVEGVSSELQRVRQELLSWLAVRKEQGLEGDTYRMGRFEVRPGDWLLMRNPSPYNLFTNLSPGLFTHVGVVALETGSDGRRRMVIVDLPERGTSIPATNVETYVLRTRHYMFVRHPDPDVAADMAAVAASIVGNPSEFDLNFRTEGVLPLKGQPLEGKKIRTYCAGLLLLCAQETSLPRKAFFPLAEGVAGGNTATNLKTMGLSIGKDFISPTGALFSPQLQIAGRVAPMYDPGREIEEGIFDHFAQRIEHGTLRPSHTIFQSLRLKLAEAANGNAQLAAAIRAQADIGPEMDLVAAAKAQAVIETVDEVAYGASGDFQDALFAITAGKLEDLPPEEYRPEDLERFRQLRQRHADLYRRFTERDNTLTPRRLRTALVEYYIRRGKQEMDERFFTER